MKSYLTSYEHPAERVYSSESSIHGKGLYARQVFSAGDYIGIYAGPVVEDDGIYVPWLMGPDSGVVVSGIRGENLLKFMNHARPANAEFDGEHVYACRPIKIDDEITIDYGEDW
jgi:hypothetical protein